MPAACASPPRPRARASSKKAARCASLISLRNSHASRPRSFPNSARPWQSWPACSRIGANFALAVTRSEVRLGDKTHVTIYDLDAQKMYIFDSKKKEADLWDMADFAQELSKKVDASSMKASLKPNVQTRQIAGASATGYDMDVSMRSAMGGNQSMMMTVTLQGPVWIVKGAPGTEDYTHFYRAAVEKGWIFGDPRAAKGQPGHAKAMAEMYKQISEIGGIAYESDQQV